MKEPHLLASCHNCHEENERGEYENIYRICRHEYDAVFGKMMEYSLELDILRKKVGIYQASPEEIAQADEIIKDLKNKYSK